ATSAEGFKALAHHWAVHEESAEAHGQSVDRSTWRLVAPMHLAPTREQAFAEVAFGLERFQDYFADVMAGTLIRAEGRTTADLIEWINASGFGVIGTPDDAIAMIERLREQTGGFG